MQYRKKPVLIEAFMYGIEPRPDWFNDKVTSNDIITYAGTDMRDSSEYYCEIKTLEGVMRGNCRDYIIKGVQGEIYPCKPDIFEMTYELASTLPQQEISDESWEGCDGCTEQDEIMYKNGYVKGYNTAIAELPKEISDEEIEKAANYFYPLLGEQSKKALWINGCKWYREQLKQNL
jgi:hypothetical protein